MMPTEPNVSRVLLRVELADGQVREFEACEPHSVELTISAPAPDPLFPDLTAPLSFITAGETRSVQIGFKANRDHRKSITIRTDDGTERCTRCGSPSLFWHPEHRQAV